MDQRLHSLLQKRGVASVLVRPASLLSASGLRQGVFPTVMMTRLSIIRSSSVLSVLVNARVQYIVRSDDTVGPT